MNNNINNNNNIFELARRRCYVIRTSDQAKALAFNDNNNDESNDKSDNSNHNGNNNDNLPGAELVPVLEELPKWGLLRDVIKEIEVERTKLILWDKTNNNSSDDKSNNSYRILIAVRDEHTAAQLSVILFHHNSDSDKNSNGAEELMNKYFEDFLKSRSDLKKLKLRTNKSSVNNKNTNSDKSKDNNKNKIQKSNKNQNDDGNDNNNNTDGSSKLRKYIHIHCLDLEDPLFVFEYNPHFVIMYDPSPKYIRELEVYKAIMNNNNNNNNKINKNNFLRVYFLTYEDSLEEHKFLSSLKRERTAFENLIREKAHMSHSMNPLEEEKALLLHNNNTIDYKNTLIAGGRINTSDSKSFGIIKNHVIVDVREFMSTLPAVLHSKSFHITPITLEVGDYILSPKHCVERKSVSDLQQSMLSGRLYNQVTV